MLSRIIDGEIVKELFRTASAWRGAVIGGAVLTVLAVIFPPASPPHPRGSYTPPAPLPAASGPQAPAIPTGAQQAAPTPVAAPAAGPLLPVAPVVPRIRPSGQADTLPDDQPQQPASHFGEAKEGDDHDTNRIKPEQPDR